MRTTRIEISSLRTGDRVQHVACVDFARTPGQVFTVVSVEPGRYSTRLVLRSGRTTRTHHWNPRYEMRRFVASASGQRARTTARRKAS